MNDDYLKNTVWKDTKRNNKTTNDTVLKDKLQKIMQNTSNHQYISNEKCTSIDMVFNNNSREHTFINMVLTDNNIKKFVEKTIDDINPKNKYELYFEMLKSDEIKDTPVYILLRTIYNSLTKYPNLIKCKDFPILYHNTTSDILTQIELKLKMHLNATKSICSSNSALKYNKNTNIAYRCGCKINKDGLILCEIGKWYEGYIPTEILLKNIKI